ncbi:MAG: glycoside-pentoside-hexuronide (GPH):cation symporter [Prevotella sp.]|nr:glycoside-pentoside-hexuronide (GPH):cation symporter [Prevotella sp.]
MNTTSNKSAKLSQKNGSRVSLTEKIGYALGDAAAGGITWKVMSIAFPVFFTSIFGLTVADTAALMLIARMFDVVTDPLMGSLADRTQSRWGTYRPWLIYGAIPFGLIFALLLYTPDFGPVGKRIWAYTFYLLMMAVYTAVNVPYGSLLGVMTDNDDEKNQFSSFRMVGAYAMGFITLFSFPYLQKMVGGTEQHQYAVLGIFFGVVAALGTLASGLMTKERLKPVRAEKFSFKPFADLFKNKPWIYLTLIGICTNFFNGFRYAVAAYMFDYILGKEITMGGLIINYTVFMMFGEATCMVFGGLSPKFTKMVGSKRRAFIIAAAICVIFSVLYFFMPRDPAYIWLLIAIVILTSVGIGLYSPLLWSMYADVADYATEKNGTSSTGLIFSSGTMAQKFGTAISGSLVAMLLGFSGFVSGTDPATGETIVTITDMESVKSMIWCLFSIFPAIIAGLIILLTLKYPIRK